MPTRARQVRRSLRIMAVAGLIPLLLVGMVLLGLDVRDRMRALQDTASDNAQWVVLQSEVETLKLMAAVHAAEFGGPDSDLAQVRQWFDILFSRIALIDQRADRLGCERHCHFGQ